MPDWIRQLPAVNASLNGLATVLLVTGYVLIKRGHRAAHQRAMLGAFGTSVLFLACYVVYHAYAGSKPYPASGVDRYVYWAILASHVVLAAAVPFLAIATIWRAWQQDWTRHRALARITFPIWLYVSVTGVIIYWMLYHFAGVQAG